jgi:FtsH-binding integral membrane protein
MFDYSRPIDYSATLGQRQEVMGKVLSLLGVAAVCTALGAVIGLRMGPGAFILSLVGSIGTLIALYVVREKSPANLWLMYAFATFEGMLLGLVVESYLARGLGGAVMNAAVTTGAVTLAAGTYGANTKRDLTGMGNILAIGLFAVIIASVLGIFINLGPLYILISAASAVLFTGFLVYDLNRVANAQGVTQGQTILLAVSVYLDIFNLFLALLQIFGIFGGRDD